MKKTYFVKFITVYIKLKDDASGEDRMVPSPGVLNLWSKATTTSIEIIYFYTHL